jgi:UDP-glucose 4-epimerase
VYKAITLTAMSVLITGGCGFIGRNLIGRLITDLECRIRIVDNFSVGRPEDIAAVAGHSAKRIEIIEGDIADEALARRAVAGVDAVVHLAANTGVAPSVADPRADCLTNVIGTLNYLEACRHGDVRRFVFASSGAPIGNCEPPLHEELPAHPVSPYGASKLAGEAYCSAYKRSFGIDTVALRFGNCYGRHSSHKSSVVAKFIREAVAGQAWEIYGDGGQTRDFIYADDVVDAIVRATSVPAIGGETFQIATNAETTVSELAAKLAPILKQRGVPPSEIRYTEPRTGDVRRNYSDTRKARERLSWSAHVSLDEGLERVVEWFLPGRSSAEQTERR